MKYRGKLIFAAFSFIYSTQASAQGMAINTTGSAAAPSAMLDVSSTSQGVLVPRMTAAQRTAISSPATGLLVYQTDATAGFYFYNGSAWTSLNTPANTTLQGNTFNGASQLVQLNASSQLPAVSGANLTNLNAGNIATGTVATARLGSGTASSSTYLRGDGSWQTPPSGGGGGSSVLELVAANNAGGAFPAGGSFATPQTTVTFGNVITSPTTGSFDGTTFTVGTTGNYIINVTISSSGTNFVNPWPILYVNGSVAAYGVGAQGNPTTVAAPPSRALLSSIIRLNAGDNVLVKVLPITTTAGNISSDGTTKISILRM